jgi:D-alanyl-D-alanine carboxypeptidase/D-alanyl-D-alanine-endopeptidase (penicillin-binding protein 4)
MATAEGIQNALAGALSTGALGPNARIAVYDTDSGELLFGRSQAQPATPASTDKLLTAAAVLDAYGPDHRITTSVVQGSNPQEIMLVGAGDPFLTTKREGKGDTAAASLAELADGAAEYLKREAQTGGEVPVQPAVSLVFNDNLFSGPRTAPSWPSTYVSSGLVSPITALMVDGGGGSSDPSLAAAQAFATLLRERGIAVAAVPKRTSSTGGERIAATTSAPLNIGVGYTLAASDNTAAEVLAHLAGVKHGGSGSFAGGVAAVNQTLTNLGVSSSGVRLVDGSGLSRDNEIPAEVIGQVLNKAATAASASMWPIAYGIPIAGFTGTLTDRFTTPAALPGRGEVRAKTGTLTGVSALAGLVTDASGDLLTFVFMAPQASDVLKTQAVWDAASSSLAQCGCQQLVQ